MIQSTRHQEYKYLSRLRLILPKVSAQPQPPNGADSRRLVRQTIVRNNRRAAETAQGGEDVMSFAIQGNAGVVQALVTLSGAASATVTSDTVGNFEFPNLA